MWQCLAGGKKPLEFRLRRRGQAQRRAVLVRDRNERALLSTCTGAQNKYASQRWFTKIIVKESNSAYLAALLLANEGETLEEAKSDSEAALDMLMI